MINIFKVDPMTHTPFSSEPAGDFLRDKGIVITDNKADCHLFVSRHFRQLIPLQLMYGTRKKYLVWTHEPRFDTHFENKVNGFIGLPDVHIMNAYTGDIYLNNYTRYGRVIDRILPALNAGNFSGFKHKKIAALMIYRNHQKKWSLKREGEELDLCYLRTQIALEGHKLNKVDIYGRGWPGGISIEDSREQGWKERKLEILKNYHFNLCFENTNIDYYCSEKIWDSIKAGCLPIYYGKGNKIYEDFPKNSFLDYCEYETPQDLFEKIDKMEREEFGDRMNLCIEVFNKIYLKRKAEKYYGEKFDEKILLNISKKIKEIVNSE